MVPEVGDKDAPRPRQTIMERGTPGPEVSPLSQQPVQNHHGDPLLAALIEVRYMQLDVGLHLRRRQGRGHADRATPA
jgi:hypothetical protein